jgi:hypothetical protein
MYSLRRWRGEEVGVREEKKSKIRRGIRGRAGGDLQTPHEGVRRDKVRVQGVIMMQPAGFELRRRKPLECLESIQTPLFFLGFLPFSDKGTRSELH